MFFDNALEYAPNVFVGALDDTLCAFDIVRLALGDKLLHDKRLERHFFGQTALVHFQFRADDDNATAGIVDALTQEVLPETALLTAEQSRKRLEFAVARARNGLAAATVVDQRVDGFLQHTLFVATDDVGRAQFHQFFETVIAVDDAAIQVV